MRILAIRGKNLASLAGEFELRFQQSPLAAAGLFAFAARPAPAKAPCSTPCAWRSMMKPRA